MRSISTALVALVLTSAPLAHAQDVKAETPDQKALFALGARIAKDFKTLGISEAELKFLKAGMDALYTGKAEVNLEDKATVENIRRFQRERVQKAIDTEKAESKKFLEKASKEKGATKADSGLIFITQEEGKGETPKATDTVKVTYEGKLRDGTVFDSATDEAQAVSFPLNRVIPCWQEALQKLKQGGKAKFFCPSDIAYGDNGSPPAIPPGAALQFEVKLIEITEGAADAKPAE